MKHALATLFVLFACFAMGTKLCTVKPLFIVKTAPTGSPSPGSTVTFQVTLNQAASGSQPVAISSSTPSQFSSLPSTIYVADGEATQSFQATLSTSASGSISVGASCNGTAVNNEVNVQNY